MQLNSYIIGQCHARRKTFVLLVAVVLGVLRCVVTVFGEQFAVMNSGMTVMLVLFASNWAFYDTVRGYPQYTTVIYQNDIL